MKATRISFVLIILLNFSNILVSNAQYGYSPFVDSLILQVTDSSLCLLDRQLSGDTTVVISGVTDTIISRHSNYPDNEKAAQFILEKLQSYGLEAYIQQYDANGQNIIATLEGTEFPEQQYIICGHYDAMPNGPVAPGADDNASGVCALLEAARLMSSHTFPYTIKFVAFDEEEQGLIGSQYYTDSAYLMGHQILGVLNQDMISWDGNNDFGFSVSTNTASLPLLESHVDNLQNYQPILSPNLLTIGSSDHFRFWGKGYPALLTIEQHQVDFNPYYHTVNDKFSIINRPYFLAMSRGVIASLWTFAGNYRMTMTHQPLETDPYIGERDARLIISGPNMPDSGANCPRMYYRLEEEPFNYVIPNSVSGDTFNFVMPGFPLGSKVSYYFAAQDSAGDFVVTLPEYGKGLNPPGGIQPPQLYTFYILEDTSVTYCASGLPLTIPGYDTIFKNINILQGGRILDLDVNISLSHPSLRDINLYLISPSGREIMLSTKNGYTLDHYQNTVFDDEATLMITQSLPPYTGSFRPEQPLSILRDTTMQGTWSLKITNTGSTAANLTACCLKIDVSGDCKYVDVSRPVSGDGQTWETALTSISEAVSSNPDPGSIVFIKPGIYPENLVIGSSGTQILPLITGIELNDTNRIQFPSGTDLDCIDLSSFPGKYFAYVFRSRHWNDGFYQISEVNDTLDYVRVNDVIFREETGVAGDSLNLSVTIGFPVIYKKYSVNPDEERVILDSIVMQNPAIYLGTPVGDGSLDAIPANFNIIDGIDISGNSGGIGVQIQSSSFNVVCNSRIYDSDSIGVYINGNSDHPALFNIISGNEIFDSPSVGIAIGNDFLPESNNQTHFSHIIGNNIRAADSGAMHQMKSAVHISEYTLNSVVERNYLHDFNLQVMDRGAIEVHSFADGTRINGNILKDIGKNSGGTNSCIRIHAFSSEIRISNNIIYNSVTEDDDVFAFRIDGTEHQNSRMVHNTVFNLDNGLMLENYGDIMEFGIFNNLFQVNDDYIASQGNPGTFNLSNNLYFSDPVPNYGMPYFNESGRQIGDVDFVNAPGGDFRLLISSDKAICSGILLSPTLLVDIHGVERVSALPDVGACELENKVLWLGAGDQDWHNPLNWSDNSIPDAISNVVINETANSPLIINGDAFTGGILLKAGSHLQISGDHHLITNN